MDRIRTLARSRLDKRGMPNSKPGLWFQALEQIEQIAARTAPQHTPTKGNSR